MNITFALIINIILHPDVNMLSVIFFTATLIIIIIVIIFPFLLLLFA